MSLSVVCLGPAAAIATEVTVTVSGVRNADGAVAAALFGDAASFLQDGQQVAGQRVPAAMDSAVLVFENIPPGRYAISAYHDENDNGRLDTNFLGLPTEGVAFSNGQRPSVHGPPSFEAAQVTVGTEPASFGLMLHYR